MQHKNGSGRAISALPKSATKIFDNKETQIYDESGECVGSSKTGRSSHAFQISFPGMVENLLVYRTVYYLNSLQCKRPASITDYLTPAFRVLQGVWKSCRAGDIEEEEETEDRSDGEDEEDDEEDDEVLSHESEDDQELHVVEEDDEEDVMEDEEDDDEIDMVAGDDMGGAGTDLFGDGYGSADELAALDK